MLALYGFPNFFPKCVYTVIVYYLVCSYDYIIISH